MPMSSRAAVAAGLSLMGLACLVGQSSGQQDRDVQKTTASQAPAAKVIPPAVIGTVDIEAVFRAYDKVKVSSEAFKGDVMARQGELNKLAAEGKQAADMMAKFAPGSTDFKKTEAHISELKAKHQVLQEQSQSEFAQREADALASLYRDIQEMVGAVARARKMNYVVKISKEPISGNEPNSVVDAMRRTVVYADPATDITNDVVYWLNKRYKEASGPPANTAPSTAKAAPSSATSSPTTNK